MEDIRDKAGTRLGSGGRLSWYSDKMVEYLCRQVYSSAQLEMQRKPETLKKVMFIQPTRNSRMKNLQEAIGELRISSTDTNITY